jgi:hypothetical protein
LKTTEISISTEDRMILADLCRSESWQVVERIADYFYENTLKQLLSVPEAGDFRFTQGMAHGIMTIVENVKVLSRTIPDIPDMTASEFELNARKRV